MSRRAAATTADVARVVRGAVKGGLPRDSFIVEVVGEIIRLLPVAANAPSDAAADAERLMREAFGE